MNAFRRLAAGIEAEAKKRAASNNKFIKNGTAIYNNYNGTADPDAGLRKYSTDLRWKQYTAGEIDRRAAVEKAQKRAAADVEKSAQKYRGRLKAAEAAPDIEYIDISIEWKRNPYWGWNPHAEVRTGAGRYTGTASGCGYDKESAAVAECFNAAPEILKLIYNLANGRKRIPYGANYTVYTLPFFDGGVGMSSFTEVLKACNFKLISQAHGNTYDHYYYERIK